MCVGFARAEDLRTASRARPGSAVYLVGSDTGRDGIAGASLLASFELGAGAEGKRPSVQVGNPFLEKLLLEATLELVAADAVEAVQDLGAAGPTFATSEVAPESGAGMRVHVSQMPPRGPRVTPPGGVPLGSPAVASRRTLYRTYDQMVGPDTVLGPGADAAVMRIKGRPDGIAVTIDAQPRLAALDPFVGAASAVAEAARNLVCVGAEPLAVTDCLNLGNPERPRGAYDLEQTVDGIRAACDALGVPVVSGNLSLYNATRGVDI